MPEMQFWPRMDSVYYRDGNQMHFVSPATQAVLRQWDVPLWEASYESRCPLPMWERPDIFRRVTYNDAKSLKFQLPGITTPQVGATPGRMLSLQNIHRETPVVLTDKELYHHEVQRGFCVFAHYDTMTEHQFAAFMGLNMDKARKIMGTLHEAGLIITHTDEWSQEKDLGKIWRFNNHSTSATRYQDGMNPILKMLTLGDSDLGPTTIAPGKSLRTSVRHNLYTTEILLRLIESCENILAVWGDMFAASSMFHDPDPDAKKRKSHGDAVIVTKNGSIIILEVVGGVVQNAGTIRTIIEKTASWVGVIANSNLDISVLFVDTTFNEDKKDFYNAVKIGLKYESDYYAPYKPTRIRALKKIGIVSAPWWFPDDGCVSRAATRIGAYSPQLHKFHAYDIPDPEYSTPELRRDVVTNSIAALHTPRWVYDEFKECPRVRGS